MTANNGNRVVVAFTTDCNYVYYTGVALATMLEHVSPEHRYHVVILSAGLDEACLQFIRSLIEPYSNVDWEHVDVSSWLDEVGREKFFVGNINIAAYYRLALLRLMPDESRILYLDSDIVVQSDVAALWKTDLGKNAVAAARDLYSTGFPLTRKQRDFARYCRQVLGLKSSADYFNDGILLMNLEVLRQMDFLATAQRYIVSGTAYNTQEQDIINIVLDGKCLLLDRSWNRIGRPDRRYDARDHIVHFAGLAPWRSEFIAMGAAWWRAARRMSFFPELMKKYPPIHAKYNDEMNFELRYNEMLESSCWRITAPIRWLRDRWK